MLTINEVCSVIEETLYSFSMVDGRYMATNWIWCWLKYSYLKIFILRRNIQNDLNFGFDQQDSKVNLQKTSSPESPSNMSPGLVQLVNL